MVPRRRRRRGAGQFKRRRSFKKRSGKQQWGGSLKFATRYPGGNRATQVPMPQTFFTKHPYYELATVNALDDFIFRDYLPSSLFNINGSGADAGFASAMNTFYVDYVVLGFAYKITVSSLVAAQTLTFTLVPWPTNDDPTNISEMDYRPGAKSSIVGVMDGGQGQKSFSGYVKSSALYGVNVADEKEFWGAGTTAPSKIMHLYFSLQNNSDSQDWNFSYRVHLTMYVKWFNRKEIAVPSSALGAFEVPLAIEEKVEEKMEDAIAAL